MVSLLFHLWCACLVPLPRPLICRALWLHLWTLCCQHWCWNPLQWISKAGLLRDNSNKRRVLGPFSSLRLSQSNSGGQDQDSPNQGLCGPCPLQPSRRPSGRSWVLRSRSTSADFQMQHCSARCRRSCFIIFHHLSSWFPISNHQIIFPQLQSLHASDWDILPRSQLVFVGSRSWSPVSCAPDFSSNFASQRAKSPSDSAIIGLPATRQKFMGMGDQGTFCWYKALHYIPLIFWGKDIHRKMVFDINTRETCFGFTAVWAPKPSKQTNFPQK